MTDQVNRRLVSPAENRRYAGEAAEPGEAKKASLRDQLKFETLLEFADARRPRFQEVDGVDGDAAGAERAEGFLRSESARKEAAAAAPAGSRDADAEADEPDASAPLAAGGIFGLFGGMAGTLAAGAGAAAQPGAPAGVDLSPVRLAAEIAEAADALAVKKAGAADERSEILIDLKRDVLPETRVRIARDADGRQTLVEFTTRDQSVNQFLVSGQDGLRRQLAESLGGEVTVTVTYAREDRDGEADRRGRAPDWDVVETDAD